MSKPRYKWQPMRVTTDINPPNDALLNGIAAHYKITREEAAAMLAAEEGKTQLWINDTYQVQARNIGENLVQLNIRRRDGGPILRDWRHFQNIKNDILGPECEAIELYPAESRLVDTSNKFHLWGVRDPTFRFPIGFDERETSYVESDVPGLRQRPL